MCTYNVEKVYACVRWTSIGLDVEGARWHSSTGVYPSAVHPHTPLYTKLHAHARACAHTSAAPPRTMAAHASTTDRARSAAVRARAESGAYRGQGRDSRGVPRADVRVEGRRRVESLRAETATLGRSVKCSHALARMRARQRTHTSARTHARLARTWRMSASAIREYDDRRTGQGACICCTVYQYRPTGVCRPMAVRR